MLENYNIRDDYYVEKYFEEKDLSEETAKTYEKELMKFCKAINKTLKNIIGDCKSQQEIETEEILSSTNEDGAQIIQRRIIKFDVDGPDSLIMQHFKEFKEYCKSRGNKNTTINSGLDTIRAVLSHFKVELPNFPNLEDDANDWEILSKDDLKFVLADSSLMHKSLTLFMISTGFRIYDCLNLTIGDYMEATSDFHDYVEVDDFIDNASDDMRGYWDFEPHKTEKKHTKCKVFNSEESNRFILQNLRRIKNEYIPSKSKKIQKKLKLNKSDSLFGSKRGFYKKSPTVQSISTMFGRKNKKLYMWHINQINQNISDGKISAEDYDRYVDLIPKFHPHACRKYFCTMIERHTSNERRYRLMEGHAPKNKLDNSYINISKNEIAEIYDEAVMDLSVYIDDDKDIEKLREDFNQQLDKQEERHQNEINLINIQHQEEISSLKQQLINQERQLTKNTEVLNNITTEKTYNSIFAAIANHVFDNYFIDNPQEEDLIVYLATDYATEHKEEFEFTETYIKRLINRIRARLALDGRPISEQHEEYMLSDTENFRLLETASLIEAKILTNPRLRDLIGEVDGINLEDMIVDKLSSPNYNVDDLSREDVDKIIEEVMMDFAS